MSILPFPSRPTRDEVHAELSPATSPLLPAWVVDAIGLVRTTAELSAQAHREAEVIEAEITSATRAAASAVACFGVAFRREMQVGEPPEPSSRQLRAECDIAFRAILALVARRQAQTVEIEQARVVVAEAGANLARAMHAAGRSRVEHEGFVYLDRTEYPHPHPFDRDQPEPHWAVAVVPRGEDAGPGEIVGDVLDRLTVP